jgi:hypothetical protein
MMQGGNDLEFTYVAKELFSGEKIDTFRSDFINLDRVAIGHADKILRLLGLSFSMTHSNRVHVSSSRSELKGLVKIMLEHWMILGSLTVLKSGQFRL